LAPLNAYGSAVGASTRRKICQREPSERAHHLDRVAIDERSPSRALTVIGKKQIRATITSFGQNPDPKGRSGSVR